MNLLIFISTALFILVVLFLWSACRLSSKVSREEEKNYNEKEK